MPILDKKYSKDAKFTMPKARAIALKAHPGKITEEKLELEKCGTGLRYSFDIKSGKVIHKVGDNAN